MTRYDIFAVAADHQWTIARGRDGDRKELEAAAQAEADAVRRGCRVMVVPSIGEFVPSATAERYDLD